MYSGRRDQRDLLNPEGLFTYALQQSYADSSSLVAFAIHLRKVKRILLELEFQLLKLHDNSNATA